MPDKYEDEIEEILLKAGEVAPARTTKDSDRHPEDRTREAKAPVAGNPGSGPESRPSRPRPTITPGKLMLAGVIALMIGIQLRPLIWVGLGLLVLAYLMYFVSPRSINYEKRWRGRSVDETPTSHWDKLKRWIKN